MNFCEVCKEHEAQDLWLDDLEVCEGCFEQTKKNGN